MLSRFTSSIRRPYHELKNFMLRLFPGSRKVVTSRNESTQRSSTRRYKMATTQQSTGIVIRRLGPADDEAVERLAQLDSGSRPPGELMGLEVEGRLLVAASIDTGASIADPFSRTGELRALVEMRIAQVTGRKGGSRFRRGHRPRARGALAGSPPGAGGRLLTLPARLS
jgi:hypothetical protein